MQTVHRASISWAIKHTAAGAHFSTLSPTLRMWYSVAVCLSDHTLHCHCRWMQIQLAVAMYIIWVTPVRVVSSNSTRIRSLR